MVSRRCRSLGMSLLECLVGLALGLAVVGTVARHFLVTGRSARLHAAQAQMVDDAQIGLQLLASDIAMAGYAQPQRWQSQPDGSTRWQTGLAEPALFACDTGFAAPSTAGALACAASGTSAALAVRYQADMYNTVPLSKKTEPSDCLGAGLGSGTVLITENRWYVASSQGRTELRCASRLGNPGQPLVDNVESMVLWFSQALAGDPEAPVRWVTAGQVSDFSRVRSVRLCLVLRSTDAVLGPEDSASFIDCQGLAQTVSDGRLRRAFHTTVALRTFPG